MVAPNRVVVNRGARVREKSFLTMLVDKKVASEALAKQTGDDLARIHFLRGGLLEVATKAPEVVSQLVSDEGARTIVQQIKLKPNTFMSEHKLSLNALSALEFVLANNKSVSAQK